MDAKDAGELAGPDDYYDWSQSEINALTQQLTEAESVRTQVWDERCAFMQERDAAEAELRRIDRRLNEISGHWLSRDEMLNAMAQQLTEARKYGEVRNKQWQDTQHNYHELTKQLTEAREELERYKERHPKACTCPWTQHVRRGIVESARRTGWSSDCPQHALTP